MSEGQNPLVDALREAAYIVAAAELGEHLEPVAFAKVIDGLLSDVPSVPAAAVRGRRTGQKPDRTDGLSLIATKLGIDRGLAERVFEVEEDEVHILVSAKALASNKRGATQELAYLVSAGRQAVEIEEQTATAVVKDVCDRFGVLDDPNFSRAISALAGQGVRLTGSGQKRALKMSKVGYEKAAEIAASVTSGETK